MTTSTRDQNQKAKPAAQAARSASRIAAAQALYQMDLAGADVTDVIREFTTLRFPNSEAGETIAGADPAFFAELLRGVVRRQLDLDPMIRGTSRRTARLTSRIEEAPCQASPVEQAVVRERGRVAHPSHLTAARLES